MPKPPAFGEHYANLWTMGVAAASRRARGQSRLAPGGAGPDDFHRLGKLGGRASEEGAGARTCERRHRRAEDQDREHRSAGPDHGGRGREHRGHRFRPGAHGAGPECERPRRECVPVERRRRSRECGQLRKTGRRAELAFACATEDQHHREIMQWTPLSKRADDARGRRREADPAAAGRIRRSSAMSTRRTSTRSTAGRW